MTTVTPDGWSEESGPTVDWEGDEISLVEFLTVSPPTFYFPDFSSLTGRNYLEAVTAGMFFESSLVEIVDWTGLKVDIQAERYKPKVGTISIHAYLIQKLGGEPHDGYCQLNVMKSL